MDDHIFLANESGGGPSIKPESRPKFPPKGSVLEGKSRAISGKSRLVK